MNDDQVSGEEEAGEVMAAESRLFWPSMAIGLQAGLMAFVIGLLLDRMTNGAWPAISVKRVVIWFVVFSFAFGCETNARLSRTNR